MGYRWLSICSTSCWHCSGDMCSLLLMALTSRMVCLVFGEDTQTRPFTPTTHSNLSLELRACRMGLGLASSLGGWREIENFLRMQKEKDFPSTKVYILPLPPPSSLPPPPPPSLPPSLLSPYLSFPPSLSLSFSPPLPLRPTPHLFRLTFCRVQVSIWSCSPVLVGVLVRLIFLNRPHRPSRAHSEGGPASQCHIPALQPVHTYIGKLVSLNSLHISIQSIYFSFNCYCNIHVCESLQSIHVQLTPQKLDSVCVYINYTPLSMAYHGDDIIQLTFYL